MACASSGSEAPRAAPASPASPAPSVASTMSTSSTSTPINSAVVEKTPDDSSKLRTFLSILRKFVGVSDIANVRFSLPAQLMEPIPNLEYWHYLDRPETFVSIGKSDDEVGRMLEVMRYWFTKDLKYVKGKPCKPYNSTLGEFFRCNWDVADDAPSIVTSSKAPKQTPPDPMKPPKAASSPSEPIRVSYITEQTSHHPPVSAYYVDCPARGISARGFDQISAKFTGTSVRVTPGAHNLGIFIKLANRDNEEYRLEHPVASLGGLLRGSLNVAVADTCFITCPKTRTKAILHYLEEGWLGSAKNLVQGVVYKYDPDNDKYSRLKDVPESEILAKLEGCWKEQIYYTIPRTAAVKNGVNTEPTSKKQLLIDLVPLWPVPKIIPPETEQLPNESRRFWHDVTAAIINKQYGEATRVKQELEEHQREKVKKREAANMEWKPRFFTTVTDPKGKPELSEEGRAALDGLQHNDFHLEEAVGGA